MLRFLTAGESHGKGLTVIIEGVPAGVSISLEEITYEMQKRMTGAGAGGRMLIETDTVEITAGVRFGKTIGAPIALWIANNDSANWGEKMSTASQSENIIASAQITKPRPGHADLAGVQKYGFDDVRNVLERASARETAARVAAGAVFKQLLKSVGIEIASHTLQIGKICMPGTDYSFDEIRSSYKTSPDIRCIDPNVAKEMADTIMEARKNMNTLGGVVEVWAVGVPVGLGSYVHFDRKLDGRLAGALMSIQSVKAVEIGEGINAASSFGTEVHDEITRGEHTVFERKSNRAGGLEGGVTNGMPVIVRVYHKPISTIYKPMNSVDIKSHEPVKATVERSDICIVPRGAVVAEAMTAFVLAEALLEKFGGDTLIDIQTALKSYNARIV